MYRAEDQQGHAVHFLRRLERAEGDAAELALQLYHDSELLRGALRGIRVPSTHERCAVSLDAEDKGPYLVVNKKNGKFVTCLGKGMSVKKLHLIPHEQLLAHIEKSEDLRKRMALAKELAGEEGALDKLYTRIRTKGENFHREELLAISALQPALQIPFLIRAIGAVVASRDLSRYLLARKRIGKKDEPKLKEYWRYHHAAGHLAVLSGMNDVSRLHPLFKKTDINFIGGFAALLRAGRVSDVFRIVWLIGKIGPACFPHCRQLMLQPDIPESWVLGLFGVMVIGLRHKKYRSRAKKSLVSMVKVAADYPTHVLILLSKIVKDTNVFITNIFAVIEKPEVLVDLRNESVRQLALKMYEQSNLDTLYNWKIADDIPLELALTLCANNPSCFQKAPPWLMYVLLLIPWLAECEAEDLYLSQTLLGDYERFRAKEALQLLRDEGDRLGKSFPVTVDKSIGRNDPCPCGSNKKYKKCCLNKPEKKAREELPQCFFLERHSNNALK